MGEESLANYQFLVRLRLVIGTAVLVSACAVGEISGDPGGPVSASRALRMSEPSAPLCVQEPARISARAMAGGAARPPDRRSTDCTSSSRLALRQPISMA